MPASSNPNIEMLELAVERLGTLVNEVVFLGGCATGLLLTDTAAPPIRITLDVDVMVEVASLAGYHNFNEGVSGFHARAAKVFELFAEHETVQTNRILTAIRAIPGARIMGQDRAGTGSRAATIAFTIDGMRCSDAVKRLVEKDIAVRNGHFYALRCLEALGIRDTEEGIIRISLVHYNTEEEVSRLVEGLASL